MTEDQARQPWVRFYCGRDWFRDDTWALSLMLFPRRDLMTRDEEGLLVFAALHVELRWSLWDRVRREPRPWFRFWIDCDVDEITTRIAARAGQVA